MNKNLELYRDELEMQGTNFFILDTKGKGCLLYTSSTTHWTQ